MLTGGGGISPLCRDLFAAVYGVPSYGAVRFCKPDSQFTDSKIQGFRGFRQERLVYQCACLSHMQDDSPPGEFVFLRESSKYSESYMKFPKKEYSLFPEEAGFIRGSPCICRERKYAAVRRIAAWLDERNAGQRQLYFCNILTIIFYDSILCYGTDKENFSLI
jgi:hypothetical protein